jgi:Zn-dependent protease
LKGEKQLGILSSLQSDPRGTLIILLYNLPAVLISLTLHELAHGYVALRCGDPTAQMMGRLSFNPLRHLDPIGTLFMFLFGFGWARPVPVNPWRMTKIKSRKAGMAITAAAGPISNVLLALIFSFLTALFCIFYYRDAAAKLAAGTLTTQQTPLFYLYEFFYVCMVLNAGLAVFNLIPISPLDGSKILAIFLPDRAHDWLMRYERYGFIILAIVLFTGILNGPLSFLREGLINGLLDVTSPLAEWIAGA